MPLHCFQFRYNFGSHRGGPNSFVLDLNIGRSGATDDARVFIAITGFDVRFTNSDENVMQLVVRAKREGTGSAREVVPVRVTLGLRDKGAWDNAFEGFVKLNLIVVDDEPLIRDHPIPVGLVSHPQERSRARIKMRFPEGYPAVVTGLISGFDFSYDGRNDNRVNGFALGYSKDSFYGGEVGTRGGTVTVEAGLQLWDEDSEDDRWHSNIDGTILFLPSDRYSVRQIFAQTRGGYSRGRYEATGDVEFGPQFSDCAFVLDRVAARFVGDGPNVEIDDRPFYRITADIMLDGFTRQPDRSLAHTKIRLGLRDLSGDWDDPYDGCVGGQAIGIDRRPRLPSWLPDSRPDDTHELLPGQIGERLQDIIGKNFKTKTKKKRI